MIVMVPNGLTDDGQQTITLASHLTDHHHHLNALVTMIVLMDGQRANRAVDRQVTWPVMIDAFRQRPVVGRVVNDRNHFVMSTPMIVNLAVIGFVDGLMDAVAVGTKAECQLPKMLQVNGVDALVLGVADAMPDVVWHREAKD